MGVGLMGSSLGQALGLLENAPLRVGWDTNPRARLGGGDAVDRWATSLETVCRDSDLLVLSTPVDALEELLPRLAPFLDDDTLVTDLGSVKREVMRQVSRHLGGGDSRFIGGHPMCGSERSGAAAANPDMFRGAAWALCPGEAVQEERIARLEALLSGLGARPVRLDPALHDRLVARVSHLPQLVAVALLGQLARAEDGGMMQELAGTGLADLTRVGSSPYALWHPVLQANRDEVQAAIDELCAVLQQMKQACASPDHPLEAAFREAAAIRASLPIHRYRRLP